MMKQFFKSAAILTILYVSFGAALLAAPQEEPTLSTPQGSNEALTVVELFTSQGCSSCPPADSVLTSLADRPNILALSWAVHYWDRLGWEDTYGSALNTRRQRAYNRRIGRGGVYTPQLFVNGLYQAVGSRRDEVNTALKAASASGGTSVIPAITVENDIIDIQLNDHALPEDMAAIRLVWYLSSATVTIGDGENRGRRLHYTNVVRQSEWMKDWKGDAMTFKIPLSSLKDVGADGLAVLVHSGYGEGPIIGASYIGFNTAPQATTGR